MLQLFKVNQQNVIRVNRQFYVENIPILIDVLRSVVSEILIYEMLTSYMLMSNKN